MSGKDHHGTFISNLCFCIPIYDKFRAGEGLTWINHMDNNCQANCRNLYRYGNAYAYFMEQMY